MIFFTVVQYIVYIALVLVFRMEFHPQEIDLVTLSLVCWSLFMLAEKITHIFCMLIILLAKKYDI